jgi:serine/threonine-protein kinase
MKLVKGITLAKLLKERTDLVQDRLRFLGIFEKVCQTVAYAHSHGVIHRDLKPANIMLGAYGEVLVMDWGLAKVLSRNNVETHTDLLTEATYTNIATTRGDVDHTSHGSVMGTFPYLAPEQATGQVDRLDQRTDVFSLGSILCEILTGQPAYCGESQAAVFDR